MPDSVTIDHLTPEDGAKLEAQIIALTKLVAGMVKPPSPIPDDAKWVALNGNDEGAGTEADPFRTFNRGAGTLGPNKWLVIKDGEYAEQLRPRISGSSWSAPARIHAQNPGRVTVKPNNPSGIARCLEFAANTSYTEIKGIKCDGSGIGYDAIKIDQNTHHIRLIDVEACNAPSQGILIVGGSTDCELINPNVHHNGRVAPGLDNPSFCHGMYISAARTKVLGGRAWQNQGHGIQIYASSGGADDCEVDGLMVYENDQYGFGRPAVIVASGYRSVVRNLLVVKNKKGAGITVMSHGRDAGVLHCTVWANPNGGIVVDPGGMGVELVNNITDRISDAGNGTVKTDNLIGGDPMFVDPANGDYHLRAGSPAMSYGDHLTEVPKDLDGNVRPMGAVDVGCFESPVGL